LRRLINVNGKWKMLDGKWMMVDGRGESETMRLWDYGMMREGRGQRARGKWEMKSCSIIV